MFSPNGSCRKQQETVRTDKAKVIGFFKVYCLVPLRPPAADSGDLPRSQARVNLYDCVKERISHSIPAPV